jgi:hypothetical protein
MAVRRITLQFFERSNPEISEAFAIVAEKLGTVYRDDAARTIVVLPHDTALQDLRDEIRSLQRSGALESWSESEAG